MFVYNNNSSDHLVHHFSGFFFRWCDVS